MWIVQTELLKRLFSLCLAIMWRYKSHLGVGDETATAQVASNAAKWRWSRPVFLKRDLSTRAVRNGGFAAGLLAYRCRCCKKTRTIGSDATLTEVITVSITDSPGAVAKDAALVSGGAKGVSGFRERRDDCTSRLSPVAANTHGHLHTGSRTLTPPPAT
jgi:hypothetical protein